MRDKKLILLSFTLLLSCCKKNDLLSSVGKTKNLNFIKWSEILNQTDNQYYAYIYSETCGHCIKLKPYMEKFIKNTEENIYLINFKEEMVPVGQEKEKLIGITNQTDLYIIGTPTLFEVKEKKIKQHFCGFSEILTYITQN